MKVYLETERLILREFTPEDVDDLQELDRDPEVRRYLDMPQPPTREQVAAWLTRVIGLYEKGPNNGYWAAIEKASGEFIGWFHFRPFKENPEEMEVGYRLKRSAWGKGYATEGTQALIRKGFQEMGVPRIVATTLVANAASRRVMEKAGMTLEKRYLYDGRLEAVKYGLDRN